ncbi:MAG: Fic family protein [Halopseudomonas sabulinigri]
MSHKAKGIGKFREIQYDNKFGITDQFVINEAEAVLTTLAFAEGLPEGKLDSDHLKNIHAHLLGDMYEWAGQFRDTELVVGNTTSISMTKASEVVDSTNKVMKAIESENFSDMTRIEFADKMADYYTKLYAISPFPDGNARTARAFIDALASSHDMQVEWSQLPGDAFNSAVEMALDGQSKGLNTLMRIAVKPVDLFDLHSTASIKLKTSNIIREVGLNSALIPVDQITSAADINKLARFAKIEVVKSLEQFSKAGTSFMRDWSATSIEHSQASSYDRAHGSALLKDVLQRMDTDSGPGLRGPTN